MPRKTSMPIDRYKPMAQKGPAPTRSVMSEARKSWVRLSQVEIIEYNHHGDFIDTIHPDATDLRLKYKEMIPEDGDNIVIYFIARHGGRIGIVLSDFTSKELDAFELMIAKLVSAARPIVAARDEIVQEGYEQYGDDSNIRLYRDVPRIVIRKGTSREHDKGVLDGPEGDAAPLWHRGNPNGIPGAVRGSVAERDPFDGGPEDDDEEDGEPSGVRQVGEPF